MTVFFEQELECVATFWRIFRSDGVTLGFTSHDRALQFDGILHRAAPGMQPTAIRRTTDLQSDNAEANGALSHDTISELDLSAGLFGAAQISIGAVNWETMERETFYSGQIGSIEDDGTAFNAELLSAKAQLEKDLVPRTSPTCRTAFCGVQCGLAEARFTTRERIVGINLDGNSVQLDLANPADYVDGELRFLDGVQTGMRFGIMSAQAQNLILDKPLHPSSENARFVHLRQGCDHTVSTCNARFGNVVNFRGEPFLPGNDLLARYPTSS